jgi:NAD(P)-dependent dehydrogenase (short-subunit alcohol dehydrogenase family)
MKVTESFPKKTVVITGAAGGLGTELVKRFASYGFNVIAVDIDDSGFSGFNDLKVVTTKICDVTNIEQVRVLAQELDIDHKGVDILVCLAGIYGTYPVTEADPTLLKKIIDVNFFGTAIMVQSFLKPLIKNHGRVIVVSSESYKIQALFQPYMISKATLEAYCRVARQELALKGVHLTVIRPGAIRTPLLNWMSSPLNPGEYPVFDQEFRNSREKSLKMIGRIIAPERVAEKIFLASTTSKPKRIYRINNNQLLTLVSLLPESIIDSVIISMFKRKADQELKQPTDLP